MDCKYVIFSLAQIGAYNLRHVKRDRRLVRGSKHGVRDRLLYAIPKFYSRSLCTETARIHLNEVSTESAYIIDYEYPIFSLAQIRRFAVKDMMKCPSHKHGSIAHTTLGNMTEFQLEKRLLPLKKHIGRKSKFHRLRISKI